MKKIIRKLLNKVGYDFIKVNVHSPAKAKRIVPVQIGSYKILMPGNNPQISLYKYSPTSNAQLGTLASLIEKKYKDAVLVDIGANVGDTIAVMREKSELPIIGVEGDSTSFSFLQRNVKQFKDVHILNQYLGEEKEQLSVIVEKDGWNNTLIPNKSGHKKLNLKTFDEVVQETQFIGRDIKLIKIDTEGFDTIILRGCTKTIEKNHPIIYLEYNCENMNNIGENGLKTLISLKDQGYNKLHIYDCIDNLIMVTTLDQEDILKQLHDYGSKKRSMIPYFDMCLFHSSDEDLSNESAK